jgi:oligopeptide transport system substrate-binding protein
MFSRILAGLAILSTCACAAASSESPYFGTTEPPDGQRLRYVSGSEPESLDPQIGTGQPEARIYLALFEGLTEMHPKTAEPIPGIAERWESNGDNTVFTFHLRKNARWSDGSAITAADFVYSWRRGLTPALAARNAYMAYDLEYAQAFNEGAVFARDPASKVFLTTGSSGHRVILPGDAAAREKAIKADPALASARNAEFVPVRAEDLGVEAVDDHTLRVRLMRPVPFLPGLVAHQFFRPVPRRAVEAHGEAWTRPGNMISSGAFILRTWKPYDEIVVVRNPMYWDAATVKLDEIAFYPLEEQTTMMNLYKAGQVDATYNHTVPTGWVDSIRHFKDYMNAPELALDYYVFNTTRPPFNDVRVRKAFNMAVDKVALAHYMRVTKPSTSFVPEGIFPGYPRPEGDPFDPVRARALLAEAGFKDASGQFDPARFPIKEVEITYNTAERNKNVAEFIQAQWKQHLKLTVPLKNIEWRTFLSLRESLQYRGVARAGWIGDYLDPYTFLDLFATPTGNNSTGWFDPEYARVLREANRETDPAARYAALARAEKMLLDVQPVMPLSTNATNFVKKPYVKGLYPNPLTLHAWKFVYIEHDPSRWDDEPNTGTSN